MNTIPSQTEATAAYEFPSLDALKKTHYKLLEDEAAADDGKPSAAYLEDLRNFMLRARATGRVLEDYEERGVAQTLLNYWATVLIRAGLSDSIPRASLEELDERATRELDESQCPYQGLNAYSESTAHLYFGRKATIVEWTNLLLEKRLLVVCGPSGSGRTSLIKAGLLPAFHAKTGGSWTVLETPAPGEDPAQSLDQILHVKNDSKQVILCIHRFDEAIVHCEKHLQTRLMTALKNWLLVRDQERRVIGGARVESASALNAHIRESKFEKESAQVVVPPFQASDLRTAIEKPAEQIGLRFEPGLVETLINDFFGEPAALTLLQFTLIKLWQHRELNRITWKAYHDIGGGQHVVEKTAEALFNAPDMDDGDRELIARMFPLLVQPSFSRELVSCGVPEATLCRTKEEAIRVREIVDRFARADLLRVHTQPPGDRLVEVSHEAVLRRWPRLWQWLDLARIECMQLQRIGDAAKAWREKGKDPEMLWSGLQLGGAVDVRRRLPAEVQDFVDAGVARSRRRLHRKRTAIVVALVFLGALGLYQREKKLDEHAAAKKHAVELSLERAERLVQDGDPAGAFLYFRDAFAIDLEPGKKRLRGLLSRAGWKDLSSESLDPAIERLHRLRLGATWPQLPHLDQLFDLPEMGHCELSPDAKYLVASSDTAVALWTLTPGTANPKPRMLVAGLTKGQVKWAAFHPDKTQPLVAIALAHAKDGKLSEDGEIAIFDATKEQPVREPIRFPNDVPQKVWFAPTSVGNAMMVILQPRGGRAASTFFTADDFLNIPALVKSLSAGKDPLSVYLHKQIPLELGPKTSLEQVSAALVQGFDHVIRADEPESEALLKSLPRSPETLEMKKREGDDLIRVRRLVLEDRFPQDLRQVRGKVVICDFRTGDLLAEPLTHGAMVNWAAFSPNGQLVITAAGDLQARERGEGTVWAWQAGLSAPLQHEGGAIASAEFDSEAKQVVTADGADDDTRGAARIWRVQYRPAAPSQPKPLLRIDAASAPFNHRAAVTRARFSADGQWIATSSRDRTARLWHVPTQKAVLAFSHEGDVNDIVFSPDGRFLATGGRDRTARVWEVATGRRLLAPLNHSETVGELAFEPEGCRLLTTSKSLARLWDVNRREPATPILKSRDPAGRDWTLVVVSKDGQLIFTVNSPSKIDRNHEVWEVWETGSGKLLAEIPGPAKCHATCAVFDATGGQIAIASRRAQGQPLLQIFAIKSAKDPERTTSLEETVKLESDLGDEVMLAAFHPDGIKIALALREPGQKESVIAIADFASKKVAVLPGTKPGAPETAGPKPLAQESAAFKDLLFSPPGNLLLACFTQTDAIGCGKVWDLRDDKSAPSEVSHETMITTAAFSPDEKWLLTGSTDDNAKLWPVVNGRVATGQILTVKGEKHTHTADVTRVLFSPDGKSALTAAKDQTAILWKLNGVEASAERTFVLHHGAYVNNAAFNVSRATVAGDASAEGDLILTSSDEPKLRVWSASTGELLAMFSPIATPLHSGFAPKKADRVRLFAIAQSIGSRRTATSSTDQDDAQHFVREVQPMVWNFQPLSMGVDHAGDVGELIAARKVGGKSLERKETEDFPKLWLKAATYAKDAGRLTNARDFHRNAAAECEATEQYLAAVWHLSKLIEIEQTSEVRIELLTRRASAYAKAANRRLNLPRCIDDHLQLLKLRKELAAGTDPGITTDNPELGKEYTALAKAYLAYAAAPRDARQWDFIPSQGAPGASVPVGVSEQFDKAISALRDAVRFNPADSENLILLAEAFAGKRDFGNAKTEAQTAFEKGNNFVRNSACARLALIGWLSGNKSEYSEQCGKLLDSKLPKSTGYALLWPSVLTSTFEGTEKENSDMQEAMLRHARTALENAPGNYFRRNTYGAVLYRARQYQEAIKQLEQARTAHMAEHENELAGHYDYALRVPLSRPSEGRPQDWLFLAMANARLAKTDPTQSGRMTEAWDWMRKVREAPELAHVVQHQRSDQMLVKRSEVKDPVPYSTLCLELLYYEAFGILTDRSNLPPTTQPK